ncbi:MAG TPA: RluA family pseudouridine synthase [Pyrinomonadaceae bacterium]|nr:RluA family pseudouridine synthase [Pyrinomonadaceae bacterium]
MAEEFDSDVASAPPALSPDAAVARAADAEAADAEALAFTASAEDAGARLDAFLAARVGGASRSRLKQLIEDGEVLVSGRAAKPSHRLRAGDTVELEAPGPLNVTDFAPEDIPLDVVYEDDSLVVVNKPAGLVVHPAAGVPAGTLANALAFHFRRLAAGGGPSRPGIVHRLDRDTSGLIVVAKTDEAHESLSAQFRAREVVKYYVALVHGATREERGRVEEPIGRDPRNRTRMAVVRGGRAALSIWRVRQRFVRYTLLDVEIKTGRTHQIRVHLAWLKHPVVGDGVYGGGRDNTIQDARVRAAVQSLGRQFLHAERLGFRHPRTGEFLKFRAPLPPELSSLLELIEGS